MSDEMTLEVDGEEYLLRPGDGALRVGRRVGGELTWLDDVDLAVLPEDARTALERGDTADAALTTALRGVLQAQARRGG